jgi:hypothetical protein
MTTELEEPRQRLACAEAEAEQIKEVDADLDALLKVIKEGKGRCDVPHDVALAVEPRCPACSYDCMDLPTMVENGGWFCQRRTHVYMVIEQDWLGAIVEVREERQRKRQEEQEQATYAAALRRAEAERDEARRDAEAHKRQTQEVGAKAIELTKEVTAQLEQAIAERDALRATVSRLNRRAQTAEAGVRDNVEACKAAGKSMGRTLANAAAGMYQRRAEQAEAERDAQAELVGKLTRERDEARAQSDDLLANTEKAETRYHAALRNQDAARLELESTRDLLSQAREALDAKALSERQAVRWAIEKRDALIARLREENAILRFLHNGGHA